MKSQSKLFIYFICMVSAMGGLLFGYDWVVIGGAKPFYELYFSIDTNPVMQGVAMTTALVGCLVGAMVAGSAADRFGRKPLLMLSAVLFTVSAIATGLFNNFTLFNIARFVGGIGIVQGVNGWNGDTGTQVAINMKRTDNLDADAYSLYSLLAENTVQHESKNLFFVSTTQQNNLPFFAWLQMLDMNVVIILTLMMIVAAFTLISAMLMIVLERIRVIGNFKAMGATNGSIRRIFIYLTGKLILKALIFGNIIGIGLCLLQKYCHIVRLDPSAYYMPYVPISLSPLALILLNAGIIVVSYLTLLGASHIISTIKPTATMRFE